jgi:two-component system, cell cycle sensor histidine kinase PleC
MSDDTDADALILRKIAERIAHELALPQPPPVRAASARIEPAGLHFAKLAHELKTPLSAIVAAAEIMRDERFGPVGDPRYQGYASGIFDSASHALGVINAMLGTATAAEGTARDGVAFAEIDLNGIVARVASSVAALLEAASLTLETRLEPGLPHVVADPVTVRQMLLNLVTNGMRATPAGGSIAISTRYDLAGPVHVSVQDTGHGMDKDEIARVLDPDRRTELSPRPSGGLGIGYPLILNLADVNGASVGITSEPGVGTEVTITFAAGRVIPV